MKRNLFLIVFFAVAFFSCNKGDESTSLNTYTIDTAAVYPSSMVVVNSNNVLPADTVTILVGNQPTLMTKIDDYKYSFILPIIASGKYTIDLSKVNGGNSPEFTVGNYLPITNPTTVINNFSLRFKTSLDTLLNTKYKNLISSGDSLFLRQSLVQFNKNLQTLTDDQKLKLAYEVAHIDFTTSEKNTKIDTNYMVFFTGTKPINGASNKQIFGSNTSTIFGHSDISYDPLDPEIGEIGFRKVKESAIKTGIAVISNYAVLGFGALAYFQPETVPLFLVACINYRYRMQIAAESVGETANLASIAEDVAPENTTTPLTLNASKSFAQKIISKFRTPNKSDANNSNYGSLVQNDDELTQTDAKAKSKFDHIKDLFSSLFDQLSQKYNAYTPQIKSTVTEKSQQVNNKFVTITNVSNPNITISATDGGVNGLQIVAANPGNNITANTPLSFKVNYVQASINNTVSTTVQATYIPSSIPQVVLSTTAISNITTTNAITGGTITSDGGVTITERGICWATTPAPTINNFKTTYGSGTGTYSGICTNLTANTVYYVRAYATNANGTFYGNEISFTTTNQNSGPAGVVTTLAGNTNFGYIDGVGTAASFNRPRGLAVDGSGNIYVADYENNRIRKISPAGVVTTLAGNGQYGNTNGVGTAASFGNPNGVAVDKSGNVYVCEYGNNCIRKITPAGLVTTFAGGTQGFADGKGTAASFDRPCGIAVDGNGELYVADIVNCRIRKISTDGVVSTYAGSGAAGYADGKASVAKFYGASGVAVDASGNVYVSELANSRIRKISPTGVVSTLAGNGTAGYADGVGAAATFKNPFGLAVYNSNLYVVDTDNNRIRKITPAGVVSTLAGNSTAGFSDGVGTAANFAQPTAIAVDRGGNLYVADGSTNIRKIQ